MCGGALDNGSGVQWASVRLENDGGAWEGRVLGVASLPGRGDIMVFWYKGTGGYEGLSYFELITGSEPWKIEGQIFPAILHLRIRRGRRSRGRRPAGRSPRTRWPW